MDQSAIIAKAVELIRIVDQRPTYDREHAQARQARMVELPKEFKEREAALRQEEGKWETLRNQVRDADDELARLAAHAPHLFTTTERGPRLK